MDENQALTDLKFIRKVMADSRQVFVDNGLYLIGWGILCVAGILLQYASKLARITFQANLLWAGVLTLGVMWTVILNRRLHRQLPSQTFAFRIMRTVWIACSAAIFILGFIGRRQIGLQVLPAVFSAVMGIAMAISGNIMGRRLVIGCAFGWWLGAILMFLFPWENHFLVFAGLMVLLGILPGIALHAAWKKELRRETR